MDHAMPFSPLVCWGTHKGGRKKSVDCRFAPSNESLKQCSIPTLSSLSTQNESNPHTPSLSTEEHPGACQASLPPLTPHTWSNTIQDRNKQPRSLTRPIIIPVPKHRLPEMSGLVRNARHRHGSWWHGKLDPFVEGKHGLSWFLDPELPCQLRVEDTECNLYTSYLLTAAWGPNSQHALADVAVQVVGLRRPTTIRAAVTVLPGASGPAASCMLGVPKRPLLGSGGEIIIVVLDRLAIAGQRVR
jgi:hypothetical protein